MSNTNTDHKRPSLVERALEVGKLYPVFPCKVDKSPCTANGFKAASQDANEIRRMFADSRAALIGVPTGSSSGLLVVDFDGRDGRNRIPELLTVRTRMHWTQRGAHALFKMPAGVNIGCSAGKLAPGVDVRSSGGYIIHWAAQGYGGQLERELAEVPAELLAKLTAARPVAPTAAGDDPLTNLRTRCNLTLEQGRALAEFADVESYDDWVQLGQALQHEYGDEGLALWDEASRRSGKYPGDAELARKWSSFGRQSGPPVTMRAIIKAAKLQGATPELWSNTPAPSAVFGALEPAANKPALEFVPARELVKRPPARWWVKGVIPDADLGLVYAESGAGKSFFVADLCMHMAAGLNWRGKRTKRARVAVICAEGGGGYPQRLAAIAKHLGVDLNDHGVVFDVLVAAPQFANPETMAALVAAVKAGGYDLVIADTMAQVASGLDENSSEMQRVLSACRALRAATGAMVVLIHHAGKDPGKGARGWSGIKGAVDFEVAISRDGDVREALVSKQKDGEDGERFGFKLVRAPLEGVIDEDGEQVFSCYVEAVELAEPRMAVPPPKGDVEQAVYEALVDICGLEDADYGIPVKDLIDAAVPRIVHDSTTRDRRRYRAERAIGQMKARGTVLVDGQVVRLAHGTRGT
jgi:AAA domain/Bifunctional DNA primase/polymerase, N-terminal/Primase C terminal 2 (PriCT-2)